MKLYKGDCLEVMKDIPDGSVDLVVTSPPYDNLRTYNGTLNWNEDIWQRVIEELYRVIADGGVVVWVVGDATIKGSETGTSFKQALYFKEAGFNLHDTMIWEKKNPMPNSSNRYLQTFEYMFIFSKGSPKKFTPILVDCLHAGKKASRTIISVDGTRKHQSLKGRYKDKKKMSNIFRYVVGSLKEKEIKHPAKFSKELAHDHIISWSNEGDTVLDPFMGSGTTGVACVNTNRNFIGIELDETYFNIAEERIEKHTKQERLFTGEIK